MKQTINTILAQFREEVTSNRELGDRFERLICRYLELDPMYVERFSRVWMWNEFPRKGNIGNVGLSSVRSWLALHLLALRLRCGRFSCCLS
jgi:predicted helicase